MGSALRHGREGGVRCRCRIRRQYPKGAVVLLSLAGIAMLSSCRSKGPAHDVTPPAAGRPEAAVAAAAERLAGPAGAARQVSPVEGPSNNRKHVTGSGSLTPDPPPLPVPDSPAFTSQGSLAQRLKAVAAEAVSRGVARSVGVAVYDMASGQGYGLNHDRLFKPASVVKLAVLVAAYRARPQMSPAQFERLRPDLKRMITISDNPATRRLVLRLGARQVNAAIQELGIRRFRVGNSGSRAWVLQGSQAAPADTALLLAKLARREVVSPKACDEMLALLGAQKKRRRIPAGLPPAPDLWVGNKTGTLNGIVNDAGIVLHPQKGIAYTVAIYTSGARSESAGEELLSDLSAVVYGYMASRG